MASFVPSERTSGRIIKGRPLKRVIHTSTLLACRLSISTMSLACAGPLSMLTRTNTPTPRSTARRFFTTAGSLAPTYTFLQGHAAFCITCPRRQFHSLTPPMLTTNYPGQIRFRITPSSDPRSFADGKDLQLPTGLPWHTYVQRRLSASRNCLWELLVRDGHITESVASIKRSKSGSIVTRFGQPFLYDFAHHFMLWNIMSESQGGERFEVRFTNPLWSGPVVYTGTHSQSFANVLLAHCLATIYLVGTLLTV